MSFIALIILTIYSFGLGIIELVNKKSNNLAVFGYLLFFVLFIVFRGMYFPDTTGYIQFYNDVKTDTLYLSRADLPHNLDFGYGILNQMVKFIFGPDYHFFFFITTSLNLFLVFITVRKYISVFSVNNNKILYGVLFALYISYFGFLYNGAVLRAGIALSILFYSYILSLQRKWIWSLVLFIIAYQFHSSSILGILIIIILNLKIKLKKYTYVRVWSILGLIYLLKVGNYITHYFPKVFIFLSEYNALYVFSKWGNSNFLDAFSIKYSFKIIFFYFVGGLLLTIPQPRNFYKLLNVYFVGLFILMLFPFSYVARVADFFIYVIFLLQFLFLQRLKSIEKKVMYYTIFIILNTLFVSRILYQGL
jgi:hypothetical protein